MPELPDITAYIEALEERIVSERLEAVRVSSPFVVRSYDPPLGAAEGQRVRGLRRLGKRIVVVLDDELFLVIHLMVAGRLRYLDAGAKVPRKVGLCAFDFPGATLLLTEASKKKRASIHLVRGEEALAALICLGYPLVSSGRSRKMRDQVLLDGRTPVLFVQGTRDRLCPLDELEAVRVRMAPPSTLHVVDTGDHSLLATKTWLRQAAERQADVDARIATAIAAFLRQHCG